MGGCLDLAFHRATSSVLNVRAISTIPIPESLCASGVQEGMVGRLVGRRETTSDELEI
jgi:hypothetical protein